MIAVEQANRFKVWTFTGKLSHIMDAGVDRTLCGIPIDRVAHLEPSDDEPECGGCYRREYRR